MESVFNIDTGVEAGHCSEGSLRLVDGSDLVGRLEVCVNNAWGTICGTQFDSRELKVACSQLGGTGKYRPQIMIDIVIAKPPSPLLRTCSCPCVFQ